MECESACGQSVTAPPPLAPPFEEPVPVPASGGLCAGCLASACVCIRRTPATPRVVCVCVRQVLRHHHLHAAPLGLSCHHRLRLRDLQGGSFSVGCAYPRAIPSGAFINRQFVIAYCCMRHSSRRLLRPAPQASQCALSLAGTRDTVLVSHTKKAITRTKTKHAFQTKHAFHKTKQNKTQALLISVTQALCAGAAFSTSRYIMRPYIRGFLRKKFVGLAYTLK